MRRFTAWITGAAGGFVAYRLLRRRRGPALVEPELSAEEPEARAEALREKLDEVRAEGKETPVEPPPADGSDETLEDRRRRVHEEGRAAIDQMQDE